MNLLGVQHLRKYFPTVKGYLRAVDDVSFTIEEGTTLGMVGESDCGKGTLRRLILRLLDSAEGEVCCKGDNILAYDRHRMRMIRQKVQIIFQDSYEFLNPGVSVGEIISGALIVGRFYRSKTESNDKVYKLMETVRLTERLINSYPHELDGGQGQRMGIARALTLNSEFIVCDEPVSVLDVSIQAQILSLMQDLQEQRGFTYVFITHNLSVVKHVFDNIMVVYLGQVVKLTPKKLLFSHPSHPYTEALLTATPVSELSSRNRQREIIYGEITSPINPGNECGFAKHCPFAKEICFQTRPELTGIEPGHFVACHGYL